MEQVAKTRRVREESEVASDDVAPADQAETRDLLDDLDDVLDEIDDVLEQNAESFVKAYVQQGGQ